MQTENYWICENTTCRKKNPSDSNYCTKLSCSEPKPGTYWICEITTCREKNSNTYNFCMNQNCREPKAGTYWRCDFNSCRKKNSYTKNFCVKCYIPISSANSSAISSAISSSRFSSRSDSTNSSSSSNSTSSLISNTNNSIENDSKLEDEKTRNACNICDVCMESPKTHAITSCGHIMCYNCACLQYVCPFCQKKYDPSCHLLRIFL